MTRLIHRRISDTLLGAAVDRHRAQELREGRLTQELPAPGVEGARRRPARPPSKARAGPECVDAPMAPGGRLKYRSGVPGPGGPERTLAGVHVVVVEDHHDTRDMGPSRGVTRMADGAQECGKVGG